MLMRTLSAGPCFRMGQATRKINHRLGEWGTLTQPDRGEGRDSHTAQDGIRQASWNPTKNCARGTVAVFWLGTSLTCWEGDI